ncbi:MAG: aminomethyl-transferring glycine dehydrogenase subunit GcvPB [Candidatus Odinarchaeia archaeon]
MENYHQASYDEPLIFELTRRGRIGHNLPEVDPDIKQEVGDIHELLPENLIRQHPPNLPQVSEVTVLRHFIRLSQMDWGVDLGFYPLGSCTMKYNPRVNELLAELDNSTLIHPYQDEETVQGALQLMYELQEWYAEITGMDKVTLQPAAGAQGEFVGVQIIRAYHKLNGELEKRSEIIIPDSAHGTNPASAAMGGFKVVVVPSNEDGLVDIDALRSVVSEKTAGLMLTNPNTLGLFESNIEEIANMIHAAGGLLYYDGANLNAILGKCRPGDMGFDIVHINTHKTFSTPHGGGGPGAGPVGVKAELEKFLPVPIVEFDGKKYYLDYDRPHSIGKVKGFYGNFGVLLKSYAYILSMGKEGLKEVAEVAVLNANYIQAKVKKIKGFKLPFNPDAPRKHEVVFSVEPMLKDTGVSALNVSKRLLDFGLHAPTNYFPLIVHEALMIEPTETESKEEIDKFIKALNVISEEAYNRPETVLKAPRNTSITRLDEVKAAHPKTVTLSWRIMKHRERSSQAK